MGHLKELGEGYFIHMITAWILGIQLILAGMVALIHGLIPIVFTHTVSNWICSINSNLKGRRVDNKAP